VFPNSSNSILASIQAGSLYKQAKVQVLNSRSTADCYSVLSVLDFDVSLDDAVRLSNDVLANLNTFSVYHAVKDVTFANVEISKSSYFSLINNNLISVEKTLSEVTIKTIEKLLEGNSYYLVTIFYAKHITKEYVDYIIENVAKLDDGIEISAVSTEETSYDLIVTLE
jgi:dihydroxyacetone kinase-like predicted kinase